MARARNIKPAFFANEHLAMLPYETRLLFIGLWTLADREGRLEDRPIRIKMQLFGADDIDVVKCLNQLAEAGEPFIVRYVVDGTPFIEIVNFTKHQRPHKNEPAIHPVPTESDQNPIGSEQKPIHSLQTAERSKEGFSNQDSTNGNQESEKPGADEPRRVPKNSTRHYPKDFQAWWKHYPNKIGKPSANKAFAPALQRIAAGRSLSHDDALTWLIDRTRRYARAVADRKPQHIKHPGPWLNDDRFNDDEPVASTSSLKVVTAGTRYQENAEGFGDGF